MSATKALRHQGANGQRVRMMLRALVSWWRAAGRFRRITPVRPTTRNCTAPDICGLWPGRISRRPWQDAPAWSRRAGGSSTHSSLGYACVCRANPIELPILSVSSTSLRRSCAEKTAFRSGCAFPPVAAFLRLDICSVFWHNGRGRQVVQGCMVLGFGEA